MPSSTHGLVLAYNTGAVPLMAEGGDLLGFQCQVADSLVNGTTTPLLLSEASLFDQWGFTIPTDRCDGLFTV